MENCEHKFTHPGLTNPDRHFCNECGTEVEKRKPILEHVEEEFEKYWGENQSPMLIKNACKAFFMKGAISVMDRVVRLK